MPTVRSLIKNPNLKKHNVFAENLAQTHVGSLITTLVSVKPCEHCLVDSVGFGLLVSLITLAPTILSAHLL